MQKTCLVGGKLRQHSQTLILTSWMKIKFFLNVYYIQSSGLIALMIIKISPEKKTIYNFILSTYTYLKKQK